MGAVFSLFALAVAVRALGPNGYGQVALLMGIAAFVFRFGSNWTAGAVVRFGTAARAEGGTMAAAFWTRLALALAVTGLLTGTLVLVWDPLRSFTGAPEDAFGMLVALIVVSALFGHAQTVLQAASAMRALAVMRLAERAVYLAVIVGVGLTGSALAVVSVLAATVAARTVATFLTLAALPRSDWRPVVIERSLLARMTAYSLPWIFADLSGYVFDWVDPFLLRFWLDLEAVGVYQAGYQGMLFISALLIPLSTIAFPSIVGFRSSGRDDLTRAYVGRLVPLIALAWSAAIGAAIVLSPEALPLFLGERFRVADPVFRVLLLGTSVECFSALTTGVLSAYDRTRRAASTNVAMAILNVVLDIALIPTIGVLGPAVATAGAYALGAASYVGAARSTVGLAPSVLPFAAVMPAVIGVGLSVAVGGLGSRIALYVLVLAAVALVARSRAGIRWDDMTLFARLGVPGPITRVAGLILVGRG